MHQSLESWGRFPRVPQRAWVIPDRWSSLPGTSGPVLPRGNGRSYGDSCLNGDGALLVTRRLDHFIAFDAETGVLHCESGVTLGEILRVFVPRGWFLPVLPGTEFVTVGGAIANDIHGKNHHTMGSFGCHVESFILLRSDGSERSCCAAGGDPLFAATLGGLGLTGLITRAALRLRPVGSAWMHGESLRFANLEEFFELSASSQSAYEYCVAWIDCLANPRKGTPGVLTRGNHCGADEARILDPPGSGRLGIPFLPPVSLVNPLTLRAFNSLYLRRQPAGARPFRKHYAPFFFPLDSILNWNRMYGPRGFLQHQCVVPAAAARATVGELLARIAAGRQGSFLAVLKEFGPRESGGLLSFARPGVTLALDFPLRGPRTFALLDELDAVVVAAGGAVYPAKDARMSGDTFRRSFPRWREFLSYIDPRFSSSWSRRVLGNP